MRLIQVLAIVLFELGAGTLLFACLLPTRDIRLSFFTLNCVLGAVALAGAGLLSGSAILFVPAIAAGIAGVLFRNEQPKFGRALLIAAVVGAWVSGLLSLVTGRLNLMNVVAGALLLGATNVAMILGHWYLLMRGLSFVYLKRFVGLLLGAIAVRAGLFVAIVTMYRDQLRPSLWSASGDLIFVVVRVVLGLAMPAVLAAMALRCVQIRNNQAATGLLYVAEVCVLFGELFAAYLMI